MPPKSDPVPRARSALQWLGGLLLLGFLAAGVVAAAVALWENVDVQSLARQAAAVSPGPPPAPEERAGPHAVEAGPFDAAIFVSRASAGFFPDSTFHPGVVERWGRLLEALGGRVTRISGAAELAALAPEALLVAPQAVCLGRREVEALQEHVSRGGGLVVDWAVGARDEGCRWRGWGTLQALTGALEVAERPSGEAVYFTVPAGLPLSTGLPPGARVELHPEPHLAVLTSGPRVYWSDWALNPIAPAGTPAPDASVLLAPGESGGRVAWFGFRETQGAAPKDEWRLRRVLGNGTLWAAGRSLVELEPWPQGHQAALFIGEDVEAGFRNALALARVLLDKGAPGTFFAVSRLALENRDMADSLRAVGEIGSQTADHFPTAGLPLAEQMVRLRRARAELQEWSGTNPRGLRPPEERYDENTLRAWRDLGGEYLAAVNDARSAAPEVHRTAAGPVVLLPRLLKDDYNVVVQEGSRGPGRLRDAYLEGMRKIAPLGGLAYLVVHSQIGGAPNRVGAIGQVVDSARAGAGIWWLATGGDIAAWWLARDDAILELRPARDGVLELEVQTVSALAGAWVEIYDSRVQDLLPWDDDVPLRYAPTEWGLRFPLPDLGPTERRVFTLRPAAEENASEEGEPPANR